MSLTVHTPTMCRAAKRKLDFTLGSAKKPRLRPRIQRGPLRGTLLTCDKETCEKYPHIFTKEYMLGINSAMDEAHQYAIDQNLLPDKNYFGKIQSEIKPWMRRLMFLKLTQLDIAVNRKDLKLSDRCLWQAFFLVDRYLSVIDVRQKELKGVGSAAYSIACKLYDESRIYKKVDISRICFAFIITHQKLAEMERRMIIALDWEFTIPNCYDYLERFTRVAVSPIREERYRTRIKWLALYAMERVNLGPYVLSYTPRCIASACILTALTCSSRKFRWSRCMVIATGYEENSKQLTELVRHIMAVLTLETEKHRVVIRKYAVPERGAVSTLKINDIKC